MTNGKYTKIPDFVIEGYKPPNVQPTKYEIEFDNIYYFDINNQVTTIKSKHLGPILRTLRGNHEAGAAFANLFEQGNETMENLDAFEKSLENKKTTVLLDYWLLRLEGRIHRLNNNKDAVYLTALYDELSEKLADYELKMGKLNTHPAVHQNEDRANLVTAMQAEWRSLLEPALNKYKDQWDTRNILLNLAACATGFGLIGLFCKNLYRLTQGKGLQLFQYERAHSMKIDKLQKLYDEVETATQNDVKVRTNYFTTNVEDTYATNAKLQMIVAKLEEAMSQDQKLLKSERTIDSKTVGALRSMIASFKGIVDQLATDLHECEDMTDTKALTLIHKDFMELWIATVGAQKLYENSLKYPKNIQDLFGEVINFSEGFEKELHELKQDKPKSDDDVSISNFSIGSDN